MKNKKIATTILAATIVIAGSRTFAAEATGKNAEILLNNNKVSLEAYEISGNNYFKLRDLAKVLDNTNKKFNIKWNEKTDSVEIISNKSYESDGSELKINKNLGKANAEETRSKILYNGEKLDLEVYNINGNNYFKLRDLNEKLNIFTDYNNKTKTIELDTNKSYVKEEAKNTDNKVSDKNLNKIKTNIESGKYGNEIGKKVLDIISVDFDYNNKPNIVAVVSDGAKEPNIKIVNISNDGKLINFENISIYPEDINLYSVDNHIKVDEKMKRSKEVVLIQKYKDEEGRDCINELAFEMYENKLSEYKNGDSIYVKSLALDNYKLKLFTENSDGKELKNIIIDVSNKDKIKSKYYDKNKKAMSIEKANENEPSYGNISYGHIRIEAIDAEKYVDAKTGYEGIKYTCRVGDNVEEEYYGFIEVYNLAMEENSPTHTLVSVDIKLIDKK